MSYEERDDGAFRILTYVLQMLWDSSFWRVFGYEKAPEFRRTFLSRPLKGSEKRQLFLLRDCFVVSLLVLSRTTAGIVNREMEDLVSQVIWAFQSRSRELERFRFSSSKECDAFLVACANEYLLSQPREYVGVFVKRGMKLLREDFNSSLSLGAIQFFSESSPLKNTEVMLEEGLLPVSEVAEDAQPAFIREVDYRLRQCFYRYVRLCQRISPQVNKVVIPPPKMHPKEDAGVLLLMARQALLELKALEAAILDHEGCSSPWDYVEVVRTRYLPGMIQSLECLEGILTKLLRRQKGMVGYTLRRYRKDVTAHNELVQDFLCLEDLVNTLYKRARTV